VKRRSEHRDIPRDQLRSPGEVRSDLHEMIALMPQLLIEFTRAHEDALAPGGGMNGRASSETDQVGELVVSRTGQAMRADVGRAARKIQHALGDLAGALKDLRRARSSADPGDQQGVRQLRPWTESELEEAEARAQRRRRIDRGRAALSQAVAAGMSASAASKLLRRDA
jgi:hypothetical protein